ncbi:MAG: maleylpyruvate isomerase family mycothiol-dependent enzyme [SAR202 cluster bacterium]|nr:maleylpyruvate isomerase family mycothiol-dependent enzyme [SAR202 cluster bacterium]
MAESSTIRVPEIRIAFKSAAQFLVDTVGRVPADKWGAPGLGEWTVRETVAHAARPFTTLVDGLGSPGGDVTLLSAAAYFRAGMSAPNVNQGIAERGRQAAKEMGDDPAAYVGGLAKRALEASDRVADDFIMNVRFGTIRFADYLPTRTFELTVHTLDIAQAVGLKVTPPSTAARSVFDTLRDIAIDQGKARQVIFALLGRGELPKGFTLLTAG